MQLRLKLPQLQRQNDFLGGADDEFFKIDFAWGLKGALHTLAFLCDLSFFFFLLRKFRNPLFIRVRPLGV